MDTLAGLESGAFTSTQLTAAFLARIALYEGVYNAFTFIFPDSIAAAQASDARRAAGGVLGALEGVPFVIKEALDVVGYPSTFGWNYTYSGAGGVDLFPQHDAELVTLLLAAGSVPLGKTNIPAFSFDATRTFTSWDGVTINAVNAALAPGASSAGTATAVAAGFAVWGIAEETGGSIQARYHVALHGCVYVCLRVRGEGTARG